MVLYFEGQINKNALLQTIFLAIYQSLEIALESENYAHGKPIILGLNWGNV